VSPIGGVVARVLALAASLVSASAAQPAPASGLPPDVESFLARVIAEWKVPGAAIGVVKDGRVIALRAYGVRELGRPEPVDSNTIFDAASLTKSFTAAVLATLVDEKQVTWDEPVRQLLPTLEFPDPYLTANVTLRDLLSHRTGVRPTNSAWYFTHLTRPEVLGLVKHFEVAAPFRT
jgi:CubicO group peptidase (beta-lactamase class C family)